jgi:hypothetical protein
VSGPRDEVGLDGAEVVELAARRPRAAALLDELAALGRGEHALGGADVPAILDRLNGDTMTTTPKPSATPHATSVRLGTEDLDKLDRVVELMATSREARLVGGRWGRSTVLRLAVERGLDALLAEIAEGTAGKGGPPASPFLSAGAPEDDNARAWRLDAPEGGPKR